MPKWIKTIFDWIGHSLTLQAILQTEFVRTALLPTLVTAMTGTAGIFGHLPLMWVLMASGVMYAAMMTGLLRGSEYLERKSPQNKLIFVGTYFQVDLEPTNMPQLSANRQQRRAQTARRQPTQQLSSTQIMVGVNRNIDRGQVCVDLRNTASFPISMILETAETEVADFTPPRSQFPKPGVIVSPGSTVRICDDRIEMDGVQCGRMAGKMDFKIRYGLAGKEHYELRLWANLDIQMETFGFISMVRSEWLH